MKWKREKLTPAEYYRYLRRLEGYEVTDVYHTQDSLIWFDVIDPNDTQKKYILMIEGSWNFLRNATILASSVINEDEDDHAYYQRLRAFAQECKSLISKIKSIDFSEEKYFLQIFFDQDLRLEITGNKYGLLTVENKTENSYLITSSDSQPHYYLSTPENK